MRNTGAAAADLPASKPVRNPEAVWVESDDGTVSIELPLAGPKAGPMLSIARLIKRSDRSRFELEQVGAVVWKLCDGQSTVEGISRKLRERFRMNRLEADAALGAFLQMLARRRLIVLDVRNKP